MCPYKYIYNVLVARLRARDPRYVITWTRLDTDPVHRLTERVNYP